MPGLTAIVGPSSPSAASHVQGMANQMHVPHIETRFDYSDHSTPYSINVHPHPAVLGKVQKKSKIWLITYLIFEHRIFNYFFVDFQDKHNILVMCVCVFFNFSGLC